MGPYRRGATQELLMFGIKIIDFVCQPASLAIQKTWKSYDRVATIPTSSLMPQVEMMLIYPALERDA